METDLATIKRLLGDVPVEPLAPGLDHRVYTAGEALVARFGPGVAAEAALLRAIAQRLPLPVPVPVLVEGDCMVLPRVPGVALLHVPREERTQFVPELLAFADAVHALDVTATEDDSSPAEWLIEAREQWPEIRHLVPRPEDVDAFLRRPAPPPGTRCFVHGDLGAEHVFVDAGRITGVIDWSDAAHGDPALDHGRLARDLGPVSSSERVRFYAVCTAIEDLAYGREPYVANAVAALTHTGFEPR